MKSIILKKEPVFPIMTSSPPPPPTRTQKNIMVAFYYIDKSVLLGTKPLVDSIRHFIRDLSGVFSVCHLYECRIVY